MEKEIYGVYPILLAKLPRKLVEGIINYIEDYIYEGKFVGSAVRKSDNKNYQIVIVINKSPGEFSTNKVRWFTGQVDNVIEGDDFILYFVRVFDEAHHPPITIENHTIIAEDAAGVKYNFGGIHKYIRSNQMPVVQLLPENRVTIEFKIGKDTITDSFELCEFLNYFLNNMTESKYFNNYIYDLILQRNVYASQLTMDVVEEKYSNIIASTDNMKRYYMGICEEVGKCFGRFIREVFASSLVDKMEDNFETPDFEGDQCVHACALVDISERIGMSFDEVWSKMDSIDGNTDPKVRQRYRNMLIHAIQEILREECDDDSI